MDETCLGEAHEMDMGYAGRINSRSEFEARDLLFYRYSSLSPSTSGFLRLFFGTLGHILRRKLLGFRLNIHRNSIASWMKDVVCYVLPDQIDIN